MSCFIICDLSIQSTLDLGIRMPQRQIILNIGHPVSLTLSAVQIEHEYENIH